MRTVVFSHNYPPKRNPRSFRIRNFEQSGFFGKDYLIISNTTHASFQFLNLQEKSKQNNSPTFISTFKNCIRYNPISIFLSKCIIPDRYVFFQIYYLLLYLFRYRKKDDLIYTVSNPFSSHLIGIVLKKYFKHTWHADIGDVYFSMTTLNWDIHRTLEQKVVYSSDRLILNSESLKNHFINFYSVEMDKTQVVPNGVTIKFDDPIRVPSSVLRFSFIGNTYHPVRPGIQEVEFILNYFQSHSNCPMILQLFGNQNQEIVHIAMKNPLKISIAYCHTDQELVEAYANTDILLNFANLNNPGLPSKLEEYVASGIPIINFYQNKDNASLLYLNSKNIVHLNIDLNAIDEENMILTNQYIRNCFNRL